jgi:hypothetical protein
VSQKKGNTPCSETVKRMLAVRLYPVVNELHVEYSYCNSALTSLAEVQNFEVTVERFSHGFCTQIEVLPRSIKFII